MSDISTCLTLADKMWSSDVDRVLEAIDSYLAEGFSQADAQRMAVDDLVAGIQSERVETEAAVREQHADLFDESLPAQPEVELQFFSDPAQWSRREFNRDVGPADDVDPAFSIRERMVDYLAARNKTLSRVNSSGTLEGDIDLAAKAIDMVRSEIEAGTASQTEIPLGPVPHVLHMLGAPMQMMHVHTNILDKILVRPAGQDGKSGHSADFKAYTGRDIMESIYRPALVTQSRGAGEWELVSTLRGPKGGPIMFVVKSNTPITGLNEPRYVPKGGKSPLAAVVMSAYEKPIFGSGDSIESRIRSGKTRYVDMATAPAVINSFPARPEGRSGVPSTAGAELSIVPAAASSVNQGNWSKIGPILVEAARAGKASTDVDLVEFIGDNYRGDWSQAPAFSRRPGRYSLRKFGIGAQFIENIQDRYNRWKQAIEDVRKQGGIVTEDNDFYRTEERFWGKVGTRIGDFSDEVKQFVKDVADDRMTLDDVATYAIALHAKERNAWIAARRPSMPDGGSGMSNDEADAILAEAAASGLEPALQRHAATLRQWIQGTRDILLNEGLIDQDNYDAWTNMFQMYVPLRGLEGAPEARGTGQGFNIRGAEGKRAFGRRSEARQIIEQITQDRTRTLIRAGKNEVLKAFAQFVVDNPSPNLWEIEAVETKPVERIDAMGNRIIDEEQRIISDDRTVTVKDAGREIHITVRDERLRAQLQNLHVENIGKFIGGLLWANRMLSRLYTSLSPTFTVINGVRDVTAATIGIIDEIGFMAVPRLWANLPKALIEAYRAEAGSYSPDYQLYRATGGKTGFFDFKTLDGQTRELQRDLANAGRSGVDPRVLGPRLMAFVEAMNGGIENATRLAAFKTSRQMGRSVAESASLSKNITVNFNRKGTMTPSLAAWFLFFNPAVQGTARVIQAVSHPKVAATLGMGMVGIAGLAMRNAGMGDDDDGVAWWDKIPSEVKERNLIIILPPGAQEGEQVPGSKIGRYIKVPMPYGYNFFAVLANQIVDVMRHQQDPRRGRDVYEAGMKAFGAFMGSWVPVQELGKSFETPQTALMAAVPDALNPIAQTLANSNAFGRKLYPDDAQSRSAPDSSKVFPGQVGGLFHEMATSLNEATGGTKYKSGGIDVAPGSIEAIVRGYGGGPATFTLDLLNALYVRQNIKRPATKATALPFAKQVYGEIDAETDRLTGYDRLDKARKIVEPFERAAKDGAREDVLAMREEFGPMLQLGGAIQATQERLAQIRKRELSVIANEKMTDGEKYVVLMDMALKRRQALQKFNVLYDRAIGRQDAERQQRGQ